MWLVSRDFLCGLSGVSQIVCLVRLVRNGQDSSFMLGRNRRADAVVREERSLQPRCYIYGSTSTFHTKTTTTWYVLPPLICPPLCPCPSRLSSHTPTSDEPSAAQLTTQDVSLATLYVSSKLHDTLKKPRDIILASYPLRYPHLIAQRKGGVLDPALVDVAALEAERGRVLGIERLVLESVCFRFAVGGGLGWVVKIAKRLKSGFWTAWRRCAGQS